MVASNSDSDRTLSRMPDWRTCAVRCGIPGLQRSLTRDLEALGVQPEATANRLLLVDLPCGFALRMLDPAGSLREPTVAMTENPCPEYWEDLWALRPAGLIVGIRFDRAILDALVRVSRGERYQHMPARRSALTPTERTLLRVVARGWDNARIARQFHVEDKTVRNSLTRVYAKLGVANRVEAALYYWGRADLYT